MASGRCFAALLLLAVALLSVPAAGLANPFGVGMAEPAVATGGEGPFGRLIGWIAAQQSAFYRAMTGALGELSRDGTAGWWLVGLAFLYGVFHAAGPGHGKAVISAYVLADRQSAVRAVALSFGAAMVQATVAVVLVLGAIGLLGMTSIAVGATARWVEIASYCALVGFGLVLTWRKILRPALAALATRLAGRARPTALSAAATAGHHHGHVHDPGGACSGHAHAVTPATLPAAGGLKGAVALMVSVGLRPCSGAIIVLVFAYAQGLLAWGLAATYAMGLGVALTVAAIATLAVLARDGAARLTGPGTRIAGALARLVEGAAALAILFLGVVFLMAALAR